MSIVRLDKITSARRQIDAAIRMTFTCQDPVAIHSVAAAGNRVVRDLCSRRGDIASFEQFSNIIRPGGEAKFWKLFNASANFVKHADSDPFGEHDFDDELGDFMIGTAVKWYGDLTKSPSHDMKMFLVWWALVYPELVNPGLKQTFATKGILPMFEQLQSLLSVLNREDQQKAGMLLLTAGGSGASE